MQDVLIKIFIAIDILFFIIAMVSVLWYSFRSPGSKKGMYVSSMYMLLGIIFLGVEVYLTEPAMTLFFLLVGVVAIGIYLLLGLVSLAIREKVADWLNLWLGRK